MAARYMWCESLTTCSYTYLIYYAEVCRPLKTPPKLDGRAVVNKTVCMVQEWGGINIDIDLGVSSFVFCHKKKVFNVQSFVTV